MQSINDWGEAVGNVAGKAVMSIPGDSAVIDLNQFVSKDVTLSRGTDINDDGMILASYTASFELKAKETHRSLSLIRS